jgi:hypothetical protein
MEIYIGNLQKGISAERLRHSFGHLGDVTSVRIVFAVNEKNEKDFAVISIMPIDVEAKLLQVSSAGMALSMAV